MQEHPMTRTRQPIINDTLKRYSAGAVRPLNASNATAARRSGPPRPCEQALEDLGLPENLVTEIEGRLRSQQRLLGKIIGVMCPPLFGCRTNAELCRVRGWDKNLPSRLLRALPKRSWIKRLRRLGLDVLGPLRPASAAHACARLAGPAGSGG